MKKVKLIKERVSLKFYSFLQHINQKMDREKALLLAANQQLREELAGTPADMTQVSSCFKLLAVFDASQLFCCFPGLDC